MDWKRIWLMNVVIYFKVGSWIILALTLKFSYLISSCFKKNWYNSLHFLAHSGAHFLIKSQELHKKTTLLCISVGIIFSVLVSFSFFIFHSTVEFTNTRDAVIQKRWSVLICVCIPLLEREVSWINQLLSSKARRICRFNLMEKGVYFVRPHSV